MYLIIVYFKIKINEVYRDNLIIILYFGFWGKYWLISMEVWFIDFGDIVEYIECFLLYYNVGYFFIWGFNYKFW